MAKQGEEAATLGAGEAVVELLRQAGVGTVFGLLGGSMLELYDALRGSGIAYVGARDERAAGHMADGYARIGGGPGVVLAAQAGPGVANLVTAVAEAHLAYSPLVAIAGAISRQQSGRDGFQELDQQALFAPIAKRSMTVPAPERLPELLAEALRVAMSGRRGPVVLHIPRDIFTARVPAGASIRHPPLAAGAPDADQLAAMVALLRQGPAPGRGCRRRLQDPARLRGADGAGGGAGAAGGLFHRPSRRDGDRAIPCMPARAGRAATGWPPP